MGQKKTIEESPSISSNKKETIEESPSISPNKNPLLSAFPQLPQDIANVIIRLIDPISISKYSRITKEVFQHCELYYRDQTAVVLYNLGEKYARYARGIEEIQRRSGCVRSKFTPISNFKDSSYPVKILCMNQASKPNGLKCEHVNALIIAPSISDRKIKPTEPFVNGFKKLNLLYLDDATLLDDVPSKFSGLRSLDCIIMNECDMSSNRFEDLGHCTTLREIEIVNCEFTNGIRVNSPPKVKKFNINQASSTAEVDFSKCFRLESLGIAQCNKMKFIPPTVGHLSELELDCCLENPKLDYLTANVKSLILRGPGISNYKEGPQSSYNGDCNEHYRLNLSAFKCLENLRVELSHENKLSCTFAQGISSIVVTVVLLPLRVKKFQKFRFDPQIPIEEVPVF